MKFTELGKWMGALTLVASAAFAATAIDPAKSSMTAVFKQSGVPVEAQFKVFDAQIEFDPANPGQAKARVGIDVASFDLGDPEYNKEVLKKEWFDAARYPKATFVASAIKSVGPGKLEAAGQLTIKGKSLEVKVPIAVKQEGTNQVFEGSLPIRRLYFNIGEGEWKDTELVADEVLIKFKVVKPA
jgi:polyisoprenoid-binding protein YceI